MVFTLILISVQAVLFKSVGYEAQGSPFSEDCKDQVHHTSPYHFNTKCHPSLNQPLFLDHTSHSSQSSLMPLLFRPQPFHLPSGALCSQQTLPDADLFVKHSLHLLAFTKTILFPEGTASTAGFLSAILAYHTQLIQSGRLALYCCLKTIISKNILKHYY